MDTMAIIAAMMNQRPQVDQMGARRSSAGMSGGGGEPAQNVSMSLTPYKSQPKPLPEGVTDDPFALEDPEKMQQVDRTLAAALARSQQEVMRYARPTTFRDAWKSREMLPGAIDQMNANRYNIVEHQQEQARQAAEQAMQEELALKQESAKQMAATALKLTGDQEIADQIYNMGMGNEDSVESAQKALEQMYQQAFPEPKAGTHIYNLPNPGTGYQWVFDENGQPVGQERIKGGPADEAALEAESKRNSLKNATIDSSARVLEGIGEIRGLLKRDGLIPATGLGGAIVRKITEELDPPTREGDRSVFSSFTDAGELDALINPIVSKIGLQTINDMRAMSETGGALGNVSNFEVRMVQAALADLNPNLNEEAFVRALDVVETAFQRAAFLAKAGDDIEAWAREKGLDPVTEIQRELQERYPMNEEWMREILSTDESEEWGTQGNMSVPPGSTMRIPTYNQATGEIE